MPSSRSLRPNGARAASARHGTRSTRSYSWPRHWTWRRDSRGTSGRRPWGSGAPAGRLDVFHYGENRTRALGYGFFADAERYDAFAASDTTPTLVYQGTRDETVDASMVARWASTRPHVTLHEVDDDHQLLASLDSMWTGIRQFLGLVS